MGRFLLHSLTDEDERHVWNCIAVLLGRNEHVG